MVPNLKAVPAPSREPVATTGDTFEIAGPFRPLVEPNTYDLVYHHHETILYQGKQPKLVVWFKIVSCGPAFETILPRYYNLAAIKGQPRKNGRIKPGRASDFVREYALLFGLPKRLDRIPMDRFRDAVILGKVRTVKTDYRQRSTPQPLQYSVVAELLQVNERGAF